MVPFIRRQSRNSQKCPLLLIHIPILLLMSPFSQGSPLFPSCVPEYPRLSPNLQKSRPDPPHPHDRPLSFIRIPEIDRPLDRPEIISLRIEESMGDLPLAIAGLADLRPLMAAGLGGEEELAVFREEGGHRGLEALGVPEGVGIVRVLLDQVGRLLPFLEREGTDEQVH